MVGGAAFKKCLLHIPFEGEELFDKFLESLIKTVSKHSLSQSHEENVNTIKFVALIPQLDSTAGETSGYENTFCPIFSTQLPLEECDDTEPKTLQDKSFEMETSERLSQKAKQKKYEDQRKGVDFIQRNIEANYEVGLITPSSILCHLTTLEDRRWLLSQMALCLPELAQNKPLTKNAGGEGLLAKISRKPKECYLDIL
ncbi:fibrous sheath-interacting protein 1-like [Mantella aurantiaca]